MGPEWIVVGVIAVAVLFGAKKIPEMARSVGRAQGEFKRGLRDGVEEDQQAAAPAPQSPAAAPAPQSPAAQQQRPQPPQNGAQG